MEHLTKTGYILLCLLAPAAWGLFVEWLFQVSRTRRGTCGGPAPGGPDAEDRSGGP